MPQKAADLYERIVSFIGKFDDVACDQDHPCAVQVATPVSENNKSEDILQQAKIAVSLGATTIFVAGSASVENIRENLPNVTFIVPDTT